MSAGCCAGVAAWRRDDRFALSRGTGRRLLIVALAALALVASPAPARAADMNKTLRVAFLVDVTGFDPQAMSDAYSGYVMRAVFDSAYAYDY